MGRDQPDLSLIVEGARRTHPSRRVQGQDYPTTVSEELQLREKGIKLTCATPLLTFQYLDFPKHQRPVVAGSSSDGKADRYSIPTKPNGN